MITLLRIAPMAYKVSLTTYFTINSRSRKFVRPGGRGCVPGHADGVIGSAKGHPRARIHIAAVFS